MSTNRDPLALPESVELAGAKIERFTQGMEFEAYLYDERTQGAIERNFEIIGEALNRLHQNSTEFAGRIPRLRKIGNFRNQLIHGYDEIDHEAVWDNVAGGLLELRSTVQALLAELESSASDHDVGVPFLQPFQTAAKT